MNGAAIHAQSVGVVKEGGPTTYTSSSSPYHTYYLPNLGKIDFTKNFKESN